MTPARRFWREVLVADGAVLLDGRPLRTPARAPLAVPYPALAAAIAEEWRAVDGTIDPRAMPLTGLANAAIDRVAPDPAAFAAGLAAYGANDLLCYRANGPAALVARQAEAWDPLLDWARERLGASLVVTAGIVAVAQPAQAVAALARALGRYDAFGLAGLSPLVTLSGSLVVALALAAGAIGEDAAWAAAELDEIYHAERWGDDPLAAAARADKRAAFAAAARFAALQEVRGPE